MSKMKLDIIEKRLKAKKISQYEIFLIERNIFENIFLKNKPENEREIENEIVIDTQMGAVKYRNSILVEDRGNEETCREKILDAYKDLLKSNELKFLKESRHNLAEICAKVDQASEEILLLRYIPGSCSSCCKLGM